jgi:hypothetical protein
LRWSALRCFGTRDFELRDATLSLVLTASALCLIIAIPLV